MLQRRFRTTLRTLKIGGSLPKNYHTSLFVQKRKDKDLEDLEALLNDEELTTVKPVKKQQKPDFHALASKFTGEPETEKAETMAKQLGFDTSRWTQYDEIFERLNEKSNKGYNDLDNYSLDELDEDMFDKFGKGGDNQMMKNFMKQIKGEFENNEELVKHIKKQMNEGMFEGMQGLDDGELSEEEKQIVQEIEATEKNEKKPKSEKAQKKEEFKLDDLNISLKELSEDMNNPAMKKMLMKSLGVSPEEFAQYQKELNDALASGSDLKSLQEELTKEMENLGIHNKNFEESLKGLNLGGKKKKK
ncbi:hypothetical protein ABK040_012967 [Willaertia magna]